MCECVFFSSFFFSFAFSFFIFLSFVFVFVIFFQFLFFVFVIFFSRFRHFPPFSPPRFCFLLFLTQPRQPPPSPLHACIACTSFARRFVPYSRVSVKSETTTTSSPPQAFAGRDEGVLHSVLEDIREWRVSSTLVDDPKHGEQTLQIRAVYSTAVYSTYVYIYLVYTWYATALLLSNKFTLDWLER